MINMQGCREFAYMQGNVPRINRGSPGSCPGLLMPTGFAHQNNIFPYTLSLVGLLDCSKVEYLLDGHIAVREVSKLVFKRFFSFFANPVSLRLDPFSSVNSLQ